jgi:hypothetical protein
MARVLFCSALSFHLQSAAMQTYNPQSVQVDFAKFAAYSAEVPMKGLETFERSPD